MPDIFYRCEIPGLKLRAYAAVSVDTANSIVKAHDTTPNATYALGLSVNAAILLSSMLKENFDQTVSLKIQGSGPLKELQVQADSNGNIRGYTARPRVDEEAEIGSISTQKSLGAGLLTVTKDIGMDHPYTGTVHLIKGDIATDTAYYLTSSEQIPSAVMIALNLDREGRIAVSGGVLIQTYPDTPESSILFAAGKTAAPERSLSEALAGGQDIREYISDLLGGQKIDTLSETPLRHRCRCSRQSIESMISSLDEEDLHSMIHEDNGAEVHCTFCSAVYRFTADELDHLRKNGKKESKGDNR
jgi:molecular chaperone Hsp33